MQEPLLSSEQPRPSPLHATKVGVILAVVLLFEVILGVALVSRMAEPTPSALLASAAVTSAMLAAETARTAPRAPAADEYMARSVHASESGLLEEELFATKQTRKKNPDAACVWTPHQLVGQLSKPRPPGPRTVFHCEPRYGPALPVAPRASIRDETYQVFEREFDLLFEDTGKLDTGGNPQFMCTSDCGEGQWTEHWGAAFASVDGHMHAVGYDGYISLMSQSKIVAYMLALQTLGSQKVEVRVRARETGSRSSKQEQHVWKQGVPTLNRVLLTPFHHCP
jgi:hypothetical protein